VSQTARDLAFGFRVFRHAPVFALASILVITLGVGTTTAIFSVVYGVMLRPLPYPEPDRLVALWSRTPAAAGRVKVNPADQRELLGNTGVTEVYDDLYVTMGPGAAFKGPITIP